MPNHITTSIEIKGPKDKIAKLIKDTKIKLDPEAEDNEFDFNGIIPMPEELNITSGSSTDLGMAAYNDEMFAKYSAYPWFPARYDGVTTKEQLRELLEKGDDSDKQALKEGKQALSNLEKYGHTTWYDWAVDNWGTKWNAYEVRYTAHDDNHLVLDLNTAWDTPREIWNKLEEMGFEVNGMMYGEMDGTETIGDGGPFYVDTRVEFADGFTPYKEEE